MPKDEKVYGYTNKETAMLIVHIQNTQTVFDEVREWLTNFPDNPAEGLRKWAEDQFSYFFDFNFNRQPDWRINMVRDVGSLWRVNFKEAAEALLDE